MIRGAFKKIIVLVLKSFRRSEGNIKNNLRNRLKDTVGERATGGCGGNKNSLTFIRTWMNFHQFSRQIKGTVEKFVSFRYTAYLKKREREKNETSA